MQLLKRYDDAALMQQAERALGEDPTIDLSKMTVISEKGVVTLAGRVQTSAAHRHALDVVRSTFEKKHLKHARIVDALTET